MDGSVLRYNPNHEPAGSGAGGQFSSDGGGSGPSGGTSGTSGGGATRPSALVATEELHGDTTVGDGTFRFYVNPLPGRVSAIIRNNAGEARVLVLGQNVAICGGLEATHDNMLRTLVKEDHPALDGADPKASEESDTHWIIVTEDHGYKVGAVKVNVYEPEQFLLGGPTVSESRWPAGLFRALGVKPATKAMQKTVAKIGRLRLPSGINT